MPDAAGKPPGPLPDERAAPPDETLDGSKPGLASPQAAPVVDETLDGSRVGGAAPLALAAAIDAAIGRLPTIELPPTPPDWDRYELLDELGRGGMGTVYRARDRRLDRLVALKFIRGADPNLVMRLLREARAQARLDHPNLCPIYEVGEVAGRAYIAMQFVDGQRLDRAAAEMSLAEKVEVMRTISAAMHEAHRLGVVHRDLKPANILVERTASGRFQPVVMDFGLAREATVDHGLTESGALLGTPSYMSPEQARGDVRAIDRRSDVYSLGATLYELLTGRPPFVETTLVGALTRIIEEEPAPPRSLAPHIPADLETIVLKCLAKEPGRRYDSARALADDLQRYIDGEPILGRRSTLLQRWRRFAARNRRLVLVGGAAGVLLAGASGVGIRASLQVREERVRADRRAALGARLGQQVKEIEWFLRSARSLPLHDGRREEAVVRQRMARLAADPAASSVDGAGVVRYALGRGHLALGEFAAARAELERARGVGVDTPELHYALGRALGELYNAAVEATRYSGDLAFRKAKQEQLAREFLAPALASLERSRGVDLESPRYLEGLIALYRRDWADAARSAEAALADAPWLYEVHQLAGDVAQGRSGDLFDRGAYTEAGIALDEAIQRYGRAAVIARSDGRIAETEAEAWLQRSEILRRQGQPQRQALDAALAACDRATAAASGRASAYTRRARALLERHRAPGILTDGAAREEIFDRVVADARRAVELEPGDALARETLASAFYYRGLSALWRGGDPTPALDEASAALERALALRPDFPWAHNDLGLVHRLRGTYLAQRGLDPRPSWEAAKRSFTEAAARDPKYLFALSNLSELHVMRAEHALAHGGDPENEAQAVVEVAAQALALDGNYTKLRDHRALAALARASYRLDAGGDPRPAIGEALAELDRAAAINPNLPTSLLFRARAHELLARDTAARGGDPGPPIAAAVALLARVRQSEPQCVDCLLIEVRLALAAAAADRRAGGDERPAVERAVASARRARVIAPDPEVLLEGARAIFQLAARLPPPRAAGVIAQGLRDAQGAVDGNPGLAEAHALLGALRLLDARGRSDERQRAARALDDLQRGLAMNPLLEGRYRLQRDEAAAVVRGR